MFKDFDHIIKNALENYMAPHVPDWEVFYDLLRVEQDAPFMDEDEQIDVEKFGSILSELEYTGIAPAWDLFEARLDDLNVGLDDEFDQRVGDALENLPEYPLKNNHWQLFSSRLDDLNLEMDDIFDQSMGEALESLPEYSLKRNHWQLFSSRLDDLNQEMDEEFDQSIGEALVNLPESTWKESHWQMLSTRLDELNDRPRLIMMKVIEAAAILLILIQLSNLYSDYQQRNGTDDTLTAFFDKIFKSDRNGYSYEANDVIVPPNSFPPEIQDQLAGKSGQKSESVDPTDQSNQNKHTSVDQAAQSGVNQQRQNSILRVTGDTEQRELSRVVRLSPQAVHPIPYNYIPDPDGIALLNSEDISISVAPQLLSPPHLISYSNSPGRFLKNTPRLDVRDISLLTTNASDSVLNSIPTLQLIKPRLHSSMGVGILADATNVEIPEYVALSGPYHENIFNAGLYFRYKIQYQNMFGSLGGDYLRMKYQGKIDKNDLHMVTLPVELGYNVVNLSSFRMYFSGGIAGRFVPVAHYSPETLNQASEYDSRSNRESNGLLHNGPFDINSYLAGRLSMGLDISVNKSTSINMRFSHDIWLKGRGIGYNLDKFRSSHIALGVNHHF